MWSLKGLKKVATLKEHTSKILYLSYNPTGEFVVTSTNNETFRF
jgi:WD40 repeat protein